MTPLWIIGSGGHAKVVIDAARATGRFRIAGLLDDDPARHGADVLGVAVIDDTSPASIARHGVRHAVIAIGANAARAAVAARLGDRVAWESIVHPVSYCAESALIGPGSAVMAGAVLQPDCRIGAHVIVNTAASADHDCEIAGFCHLGPGARLAGSVRLGEGVFLGVGAGVIPGVTIGAWSVVGAGSTVIRDLPPRVTAVGSPAAPRDTTGKRGTPGAP